MIKQLMAYIVAFKSIYGPFQAATANFKKKLTAIGANQLIK